MQYCKEVLVHLFNAEIENGDHDELLYLAKTKCANGQLLSRKIVFNCSTYFPPPKEDILLYLALAGDAKDPGLRLSVPGKTGNPRTSVTKLIEDALGGHRGPQAVSGGAIVPLWQSDEMVVPEAFLLASNPGLMKRCSL